MNSLSLGKPAQTAHIKLRRTIFVSSTYDDLRPERDAVIRSILEMGHFPVGMEMFSAADEEQWQIIQKQIDESDYYVVVIAHRYGSTDKTGLSYTEKEYDYACSKKIPTLAFVLKPDAQWPANYIDAGEKKDRLDAFKKRVKNKLISFWGSSDDLPGKVSIALGKQFNVKPRQAGYEQNMLHPHRQLMSCRGSVRKMRISARGSPY